MGDNSTPVSDVSAPLASKILIAFSAGLSFKDVCICIVNSLERQRQHHPPEQRGDMLTAHYKRLRISKLRVPLPLTEPTARAGINLGSSVSLIPMGHSGARTDLMENMLLMLLAGSPVSNKFLCRRPKNLMASRVKSQILPALDSLLL